MIYLLGVAIVFCLLIIWNKFAVPRYKIPLLGGVYIALASWFTLFAMLLIVLLMVVVLFLSYLDSIVPNSTLDYKFQNKRK